MEKTKKTNNAILPDEKVNRLIEYCRKRQYKEAEDLAIFITQQFPSHMVGWKALGFVLAKTGRISDALVANEKAVALSPQDAENYNILGFTQRSLGKLATAKKNFYRAIKLQPNFAEAHNNLGITLKELGRLKAAEVNFRKAIALKPAYANAHYNLGAILEKLGKLSLAEVSYKQAIAIQPNFAEAYNNLGNALKDLGRLDAAEASYEQAINRNPNFAQALLNLSIVLGHKDAIDKEINILQKLASIQSDNYHLRAGVRLGICKFLEGKFTESKKHLFKSIKIQEKKSPILKHDQIYQRYLLKILNWHENTYVDTKLQKDEETLYVIGESHSLANHNLYIQHSGSNFFCKAKLIKGCMQWHLGSPNRNQYKHQFETIFNSFPKSSKLLLTIGEIDCRLDSGIIKHSKKLLNNDLNELVITTVRNFLTYISNTNSKYQHRIIIQGVPCPNIATKKYLEKDVEKLIKVITMFNLEVRNISKERGFGFLDVHKLTDRGDGLSSGIWHIDEHHLSPEGTLEAWREHLSL